jgi:hypothetical protein
MPPTAKDVYIEQFLKLEMGTPLYRPGAVQVGDVGFIDPLDGFFQKLYNIETPPPRVATLTVLLPLSWKKKVTMSSAKHTMYATCHVSY